MITQLLAAAALMAAQAQPVAPACITKDQAGDIGMVFTAALVSGVARQCADHLPDTAFLRNAAGAAHMQRLNAAADQRRAAALAALGRVTAGHLPPGVTPETLLAQMTAQPANAATNPAVATMTAAACPEMNRLFEALSPLPPENIATAVSASVGMMIAAVPFVNAMASQAQGSRRRSAAAAPDPFDVFCRS